jgi:hypothetical protein
MNEQQRSVLYVDELRKQRLVAERDERARLGLIDADEEPIEWSICHCTGDPDDTLCPLCRVGEGDTDE